ncbi:m7GpppX diphosphatase [Fistulifera solaris]|uniref:M7GpppX diphosphatase n=1 Tax=Fistulifera solaris TaxID=1519565 RepID=A0A1Z5KJK2_FISSO|nr:m7GpppX diphosphatase [Fistulifera solaris]|eukprot:GAX26377.1 m7GpppX diphosphatase [Fistulifera solaris]
MTSNRDPASMLRDSSCQARVLNASDNHATFLFEQGEVSSLLKLTILPFRQRLLSQISSNNSEGGETARIIKLLQHYDFHLSSESGAEYSYYNATPRTGLWNSFLTTLTSFVGITSSPDFGPLQCEFIYPASDRQIQRASPSPSSRLIHETPELYRHVTEPYIQELKQSGSLSWIDNVLSGEKEKERCLLDTQHFLVNVDTKWRSHPDPKTTSREVWYQHEAVDDLYCLAILKDKNVSSLRDLRGSHLAMLKELLDVCPKVIEKTYGISPDMIRCFFHYQPQFYQAHIHFTRIHNEIGAQVERGHLVHDVIQNLEMDPDYYAKRTITYALRITDPLYHRIDVFQSSKASQAA